MNLTNMNWMGNYQIDGHTVTVQVADAALVDWTHARDTYLDVASKALDAVSVNRPASDADGEVIYIDDLVIRAYKHGDVSVVYYTTPRTSRNGLYVVDCSYRAVILPQGICIAEQTAGDGYL